MVKLGNVMFKIKPQKVFGVSYEMFSMMTPLHTQHLIKQTEILKGRFPAYASQIDDAIKCAFSSTLPLEERWDSLLYLKEFKRKAWTITTTL